LTGKRLASAIVLTLSIGYPGVAAHAAPGARDGKFAERLVAVRRELHENPELANRETETMHRIAAYLAGLGLTGVKTGVAKTGVVATIAGGRPGPTVAIRAPIDAFPIQEKNDVPYKSKVAGVSHACGHDAMTAMALGAAEILWKERKSLAGNVKLVFQPAEEGAPEGEEGGAPLMVKEGVLDGVSSIVTLHVDDTIPAGQVGLHPAAVYAGADTFKIKVEGKSAHGAAPWKGVDAIAVSAQIVTALQQIASRQANVLSEPVVVTVGQIQGGIRSNALAPQVDMTGTLRSFSAAGRVKARESLKRIASGVADGLGAKAETAFSEEIPPVVNDAGLVKKLRPVLEREVGAASVRTMEPMTYADDFSLMSEKVPAFYFQIGIRNEARGITAGTHTENFDVDESALPLGATLLARLTETALAR
jgi:amidohydrolase